MQYEICVRSGLQDAYKNIMPENMISDADYIFPASCATFGGTVIPIRQAGAGKTVWIAPDDTAVFRKGQNMTKITGTAAKIRTPESSGEYRIYVTDAAGNILSKSKHILRISGTAGMTGDAVEAAAYDVQSGVEIEILLEGGRDVGYIENGDYIGFRNVDFKNGAEAIEFCYASPLGGSAIEVHLDAPDGELIGTCEIGNSGGWHDWQTGRTALTETTGKHDLYFVFRGGASYLFNLMSWRLIIPGDVIVTEPQMYGDLNADERIDARDLSVLKDGILNGTLSETEAADLNGDLEVDAADAALLTEYLLGRIAQFPAEE